MREMHRAPPVGSTDNGVPSEKPRSTADRAGREGCAKGWDLGDRPLPSGWPRSTGTRKYEFSRAPKTKTSPPKRSSHLKTAHLETSGRRAGRLHSSQRPGTWRPAAGPWASHGAALHPGFLPWGRGTMTASVPWVVKTIRGEEQINQDSMWHL